MLGIGSEGWAVGVSAQCVTDDEAFRKGVLLQDHPFGCGIGLFVASDACVGSYFA